MPKTVKVVITGRVQGVFFRNWTKKNAERLGLTGNVKNLPTGEVEAIFQGDADNISKMLALCRSGSRLAKVDSLKTEEIKKDKKYDSFCVVR